MKAKLRLGVRTAATTRGQPHIENPRGPNKAAIPEGFEMESMNVRKYTVWSLVMEHGWVGGSVRIWSLKAFRLAGSLIHVPGHSELTA